MIPGVVGEYRRYERLTFKIVNAKCRRKFLQKCLEEKVVPRSMAWIWKSTTDDPFPTLAAQQLKLAISQMKEDINTLFFKLRNCKRELRSAINDEGLWSKATMELESG